MISDEQNRLIDSQIEVYESLSKAIGSSSGTDSLLSDMETFMLELFLNVQRRASEGVGK